MSWRGIQHGITAAKAGHDVVMAPTSHTYFDFRQAPKEKGFGRSVVDLQKVYTFEPVVAARKTGCRSVSHPASPPPGAFESGRHQLSGSGS